MRIKVKYFASMREDAGIGEEVIDSTFSCVNDLYEFLNDKYHFKISREHLKVAINEEYAHFEEKVNDGDIVVFIPPVAGG